MEVALATVVVVAGVDPPQVGVAAGQFVTVIDLMRQGSITLRSRTIRRTWVKSGGAWTVLERVAARKLGDGGRQRRGLGDLDVLDLAAASDRSGVDGEIRASSRNTSHLLGVAGSVAVADGVLPVVEAEASAPMIKTVNISYAQDTNVPTIEAKWV